MCSRGGFYGLTLPHQIRVLPPEVRCAICREPTHTSADCPRRVFASSVHGPPKCIPFGDNGDFRIEGCYAVHCGLCEEPGHRAHEHQCSKCHGYGHQGRNCRARAPGPRMGPSRSVVVYGGLSSSTHTTKHKDPVPRGSYSGSLSKVPGTSQLQDPSKYCHFCKSSTLWIGVDDNTSMRCTQCMASGRR